MRVDRNAVRILRVEQGADADLWTEQLSISSPAGFSSKEHKKTAQDYNNTLFHDYRSPIRKYTCPFPKCIMRVLSAQARQPRGGFIRSGALPLASSRFQHHPLCFVFDTKLCQDIFADIFCCYSEIITSADDTCRLMTPWPATDITVTKWKAILVL